MTPFTAWTPADAASCIAVPGERDDKYSRGVLGIITGSAMYPGAAVLGVEAAARTGIGMIRYLGEARELVLQRRPEVVTADGRVQAWLLGSGMDAVDRQLEPLTRALEQPVPVVLDGGALDLHDRAEGPVVMTPHHGELARLLGVPRERIAGDPEGFARRASDGFGVTVLLKGHTTHIAGPGISLSAAAGPTWLATAGAGDALAGILGALVATHYAAIADDPAELARLAATAAVVHGLAATRASRGGPLTILDLAAAVPATIAELLA